MTRIISYLSAKTYRYVAKPILFKQKPDAVHQRLVCVGSWVQKYSMFRYFIRRCWAYHNDAMLAQEVCGIYVKNPIGLSAGFDKNFELVPMMQSIGFGLMEGGSVTAQYCAGNPRPWYHRLPKSKALVVHAGLANQGAVKIIDRIQAYDQSLHSDMPLNISIAKTNSPGAIDTQVAIDDYVTTAKLVKLAKIGSIVTLNISCPNTYGGEPFTSPELLDMLLAKIDRIHLHQPIFIKMPSDLSWTAFDALLQIIVQHRVAGVTICNLAKDRSALTLHDPLPKSVQGNISGLPLQELSDELIEKTYSAYGDVLTIIGVGGVFNASDAYRKITLGASLVELITGLIYEGPQMVGAINRDLVELLQNDGYANISEAIGSAHQQV